MYLVELRPGKEELYRTGDELAAAIRSGDVDIQSRIYHRASSKWISITMHPQYKAIAAERHPAPAPLPPLERTSWTFFNAAAETLEGASDPETAGDDTPHSGRTEGGLTHPWRRPLALSVTGLLLLLGIELSSSAPRPPWSPRQVARPGATSEGSSVRERVEPASTASAESGREVVSLASSSQRYQSYSQPDQADPEQGGSVETAHVDAPAPSAPAKAPFALPSAPAIHSKQLREVLPAQPAAREHESAASNAASIDTFIRRWRAAHDSARARLEGGMRVVRLNQLFGASRLSPSGGVAETRMGIAGASNFIRVYRQQRATIEKEYQDSFTVASKRLGWSPAAMRRWYGRVVPKESPAMVGLTTSLLSGVDSLLGVLDAQAGAYTITPRTIQFDDPAAKESYSALRQRIVATVDSASVLIGADSSTPMGFLLQAIGTTRPPLEI
ncbi:MAG: hypothetical protein ACJ8DC_10895 [Gemmatimonadales bacterium]